MSAEPGSVTEPSLAPWMANRQTWQGRSPSGSPAGGSTSTVDSEVTVDHVGWFNR
jgi:hypothetical protein